MTQDRLQRAGAAEIEGGKDTGEESGGRPRDTGDGGAGVRIDFQAHMVWRASGPIMMRPQEERLLALLSQHPNRLVPTECLVAALYGNIPIASGRVRLKRLVADIRQRFGADLAERLRTVSRRGLVLCGTRTSLRRDGWA